MKFEANKEFMGNLSLHYLTNNPQDKSVDENYNFLTETVLEVMKEHFPQKKLGSRWNVHRVQRRSVCR